jgi:hypothetical protein
MALASHVSADMMSKQVRRPKLSMLMRSLLIIPMLANLLACTSIAREESPAVPKFKSIAIVNKGVSEELKARFGKEHEDPETAVGFLAGASSGAYVGAEGILFCSDPMCALAAVSVGALIGGVSGGLASLDADSQKELSEDQLRILDNLFAQILQQRTINQDIERSLMRRIPTGRLLAIEGADTLLQYRLYDVRFAETSSNKYALTLKTVMLFGWNRDTPQAVSTHRTYEHTSQPLQMEDWVQDDGTTLNQAFDACIEGITDKMLADIQFESR